MINVQLLKKNCILFGFFMKAIITLPHMKLFEMSLLFKNTMCWKFFNLLFPLLPFESFTKCKHWLCLLPPCPSSVGRLVPQLGAVKRRSKGWGGRSHQLPSLHACLGRLVSATVWGRASLHAVLLSRFTGGGGALTPCLSSTFWMHTGEEANLLASKPAAQLDAEGIPILPLSPKSLREERSGIQ